MTKPLVEQAQLEALMRLRKQRDTKLNRRQRRAAAAILKRRKKP